MTTKLKPVEETTTPEAGGIEEVEAIVEVHMKLVPYLDQPEEFQKVLREAFHHQLQKARDAMQDAHDFLLSIHGQADPDHCLSCFEVRERAELGMAALKPFVDHSELDQPTEDKEYCNGEPCICGELNTNQPTV